MGSISDSNPPGDDFLIRQKRDTERAAQEQAAALTAQATTISKGGLLVKDGGSIVVQAPGSIILAGGAFAAATVSATSSVTAPTVTASSDLVSGGNAYIAGFAFTPGAFGYDITYTRQQVWMGNDGRIAWASSSREKKTDIHDAFTAGWLDPLAILDISSKMFHYRAELAKRDDPESLEYVGPDYHVAWEFGAIAEELHTLGLWQVVVYKEHWKPIGIHYDLLGLLAIEASKHIWRKHLELRADHLTLVRKVEAIEVLLGIDF